MSGTLNLVRDKFAAVAFKVETTPGTDAIAGTPGAGDWLEATIDVTFDQTAIENPVLTGALDRSPQIVGGLRPMVKMRLPLRGSGTPTTPTPGVAPEWGRVLRCCTMAELVTAAAIGAPTAATAGTTTTATLAAPFAATAQLYRGMPINLTVGPVALTGITDYTAGRLATFGETLLSAASASTLAQIPINVLYSPTSDETVFKTGTIYAYADGMRLRLTGFTGTWGLEMKTGEPAYLTFEGRATFLDYAAVALPSGWNTAIRLTAPRWVAGKSQLNRTTARVQSLMLSAGVSVTLPENPEAIEGYDAGIPVDRRVSGSLDPFTDTTVSAARFDAFRQGTNVPLMAIIGTVPGNRFLVTLPSIRKTSYGMNDRGGLSTDAIAFQGDGPDAALFLCAF